MVLVVDEADKAPTHVTCILKNIVEGSEITLADGRRIVHGGSASWQVVDTSLVPKVMNALGGNVEGPAFQYNSKFPIHFS